MANNIKNTIVKGNRVNLGIDFDKDSIFNNQFKRFSSEYERLSNAAGKDADEIKKDIDEIENHFKNSMNNIKIEKDDTITRDVVIRTSIENKDETETLRFSGIDGQLKDYLNSVKNSVEDINNIFKDDLDKVNSEIEKNKNSGDKDKVDRLKAEALAITAKRMAYTEAAYKTIESEIRNARAFIDDNYILLDELADKIDSGEKNVDKRLDKLNKSFNHDDFEKLKEDVKYLTDLKKEYERLHEQITSMDSYYKSTVSYGESKFQRNFDVGKPRKRMSKLDLNKITKEISNTEEIDKIENLIPDTANKLRSIRGDRAHRSERRLQILKDFIDNKRDIEKRLNYNVILKGTDKFKNEINEIGLEFKNAMKDATLSNKPLSQDKLMVFKDYLEMFKEHISSNNSGDISEGVSKSIKQLEDFISIQEKLGKLERDSQLLNKSGKLIKENSESITKDSDVGIKARQKKDELDFYKQKRQISEETVVLLKEELGLNQLMTDVEKEIQKHKIKNAEQEVNLYKAKELNAQASLDVLNNEKLARDQAKDALEAVKKETGFDPEEFVEKTKEALDKVKTSRLKFMNVDELKKIEEDLSKNFINPADAILKSFNEKEIKGEFGNKLRKVLVSSIEEVKNETNAKLSEVISVKDAKINEKDIEDAKNELSKGIKENFNSLFEEIENDSLKFKSMLKDNMSIDDALKASDFGNGIDKRIEEVKKKIYEHFDDKEITPVMAKAVNSIISELEKCQNQLKKTNDSLLSNIESMGNELNEDFKEYASKFDISSLSDAMESTKQMDGLIEKAKKQRDKLVEEFNKAEKNGNKDAQIKIGIELNKNNKLTSDIEKFSKDGLKKCIDDFVTPLEIKFSTISEKFKINPNKESLKEFESNIDDIIQQYKSFRDEINNEKKGLNLSNPEEFEKAKILNKEYKNICSTIQELNKNKIDLGIDAHMNKVKQAKSLFRINENEANFKKYIDSSREALKFLNEKIEETKNKMQELQSSGGSGEDIQMEFENLQQLMNSKMDLLKESPLGGLVDLLPQKLTNLIPDSALNSLTEFAISGEGAAGSLSGIIGSAAGVVSSLPAVGAAVGIAKVAFDGLKKVLGDTMEMMNDSVEQYIKFQDAVRSSKVEMPVKEAKVFGKILGNVLDKMKTIPESASKAAEGIAEIQNVIGEYSNPSEKEEIMAAALDSSDALKIELKDIAETIGVLKRQLGEEFSKGTVEETIAMIQKLASETSADVDNQVSTLKEVFPLLKQYNMSAEQIIRTNSALSVSAGEGKSIVTLFKNLAELLQLNQYSLEELQDTSNESTVKFRELAAIMNVSMEDLYKTLNSGDFYGFFQQFLEGYKTIDKSKPIVQEYLKDLGLDGVRISFVLSQMMANFQEALRVDLSDKEKLIDEYYEKINDRQNDIQQKLNKLAMEQEERSNLRAEKTAETYMKLKEAKANWEIAKENLLDSLIPTLEQLADAVNSLSGVFTNLTETFKLGKDAFDNSPTLQMVEQMAKGKQPTKIYDVLRELYFSNGADKKLEENQDLISEALERQVASYTTITRLQKRIKEEEELTVGEVNKLNTAYSNITDYINKKLEADGADYRVTRSQVIAAYEKRDLQEDILRSHQLETAEKEKQNNLQDSELDKTNNIRDSLIEQEEALRKINTAQEKYNKQVDEDIKKHKEKIDEYKSNFDEYKEKVQDELETKTKPLDLKIKIEEKEIERINKQLEGIKLEIKVNEDSKKKLEDEIKDAEQSITSMLGLIELGFKEKNKIEQEEYKKDKEKKIEHNKKLIELEKEKNKNLTDELKKLEDEYKERVKNILDTEMEIYKRKVEESNIKENRTYEDEEKERDKSHKKLLERLKDKEKAQGDNHKEQLKRIDEEKKAVLKSLDDEIAKIKEKYALKKKQLNDERDNKQYDNTLKKFQEDIDDLNEQLSYAMTASERKALEAQRATIEENRRKAIEEHNFKKQLEQLDIDEANEINSVKNDKKLNEIERQYEEKKKSLQQLQDLEVESTKETIKKVEELYEQQSLQRKRDREDFLRDRKYQQDEELKIYKESKEKEIELIYKPNYEAKKKILEQEKLDRENNIKSIEEHIKTIQNMQMEARDTAAQARHMLLTSTEAEINEFITKYVKDWQNYGKNSTQIYLQEVQGATPNLQQAIKKALDASSVINNNRNHIELLKTKLSGLQTRYEAMQGTLETHKASLESIRKTVNSLKEDYGELIKEAEELYNKNRKVEESNIRLIESERRKKEEEWRLKREGIEQQRRNAEEESKIYEKKLRDMYDVKKYVEERPFGVFTDMNDIRRSTSFSATPFGGGNGSGGGARGSNVTNNYWYVPDNKQTNKQKADMEKKLKSNGRYKSNNFNRVGR